MKRGDLVTIALPGDFGKPRPALVVQSDLFNTDHATVSVLPITSTIIGTPVFRITLEPSAVNGLRQGLANHGGQNRIAETREDWRSLRAPGR